ncbi:fumarylacetoacetate hydrolase family protein [Paenarthrobacter ureafaciens]|uniref:fumarylacetoacetate hydrolase family protein n=1 Tax=Paenarthrobacter ureafaciens TaxID=37931 RepID=UPI002DB915C9|nr:fumarylacetoacetate hydrolase family protein [Paenarthrobacter ureafaciens]MEC3853659.1 fumarylacetoacetate hydrolase family protein [Paenarthrobacter ureafaciens]
MTPADEHLRPEPGSIADLYSEPGFGVENLPYASFAPPGGNPQLGVRIGFRVLGVSAIVQSDGTASQSLLKAVDGHNLDGLLMAGRSTWDELRGLITKQLVSADATSTLESYDLHDVTLFMPFTVADYVDFYASEHHATNVGRIFRPDQLPLTSNWKHLPIGYHGRSGTIVVSGTEIPRPKGLRPEPEGFPSFGPTRKLDIEAEIGFVIGGSAPGGEVSLSDAQNFIFGSVLVNDWSARDIQAFEYVPLGPFLGKSFATSISPWVVPIAALASALVEPPPRDENLAAYLDDSRSPAFGLDIDLEVAIDDVIVSRPPFASMYWTPAQMLAHMTVNGASLRSGDFFASGTVSGPGKEQRGSLLELTWNGTDPLAMPTGEKMSFLEDGAYVVIGATAPGPLGTRIGFGEVSGRIMPPT